MNRFSTGLQLPGREAACWDHFPSCHEVIKIGTLPGSYAYTALLTFALFLLFLSGLFAIKKNWQAAHQTLLVVIVWKLIWFLGIFNYGTSNFEFFHVIPSLVFLLFPHKIHNVRLIWVLLYFLCSLVKLDPAWIVGSYFSSLKSGLPLVPDVAIPYVSNFVILFEMIFSFGLLSKNSKIRNASLVLWTAFHFYSAVLLGYFYPVRCLLFLWVLFGFSTEESEPARKPFRPGLVIFIVYLLGANFLARVISKDPYETQEAVVYGFHMINTNYQCVNKFTTFDEQNNVINTRDFGSSAPMSRCSPDRTIQRVHNFCKLKKVRIEWKMYQSMNGGPFYETVNVADACTTTYLPFKRNEWIRSSSEGAALVGYPEKNDIYSEGTGDIPVIHSEQQIYLSQTQQWLTKHYDLILQIYYLLWFALLGKFLWCDVFMLKRNPEKIER